MLNGTLNSPKSFSVGNAYSIHFEIKRVQTSAVIGAIPRSQRFSWTCKNSYWYWKQRHVKWGEWEILLAGFLNGFGHALKIEKVRWDCSGINQWRIYS